MTRSRIVLFLAIACAILFVGNWVVFDAFAVAFGIAGRHGLLILGFAIGGLTASFIVFTILGNYFYNFLTRFFYTAGAVWFGFFAYLFFSSAVFGIIVALAGISPTVLLLGKILFSIAALIGIYGFFHARNTQTKKITVTLPHLPEAWRGKTALWMSDIHLGQVHGPKYAAKITKLANALSPDIVFIGGDLYDGTGAPDAFELAEPFGRLVAPLGVFYITGNHEEFGDNSKFLAAVRRAGMQVIQDAIVDVEGLQLIGVDYKHAADTERFRKILESLSIDLSKPSILLKHEPKDVALAETFGISLQISGHTHKGQQWPFYYLAKSAYKKFTYGLEKSGSMFVYTSSGVGTWGPPVRVGTNSELVEITFERAE